MASSSQHLTLEQFTSSPNPLPTILVPRPHALRLVELCELAEMAPSAKFLDFISGGDGDAALPGSSGGSSGNPHILVTQMALLLYLGEYVHARHLWRRHHNTTSNNNNDGQLEKLWNAAKYIYLWNTGGVNSLTSSSATSSSSSSSAGGEVMQVENNDNSSSSENNEVQDDGDLPFSTLALRALQSCQSSGLEPLATYSTELLGVFRSRINRGLHNSFSKLTCSEYCLRMNLDTQSSENDVWTTFGWKKEGGGSEYLISDIDVVLDDYDDEGEGMMLGDEVVGGDGIGKLTDIVMFLEGKMNA